jgi:hypothetical protein
MRKVEKMKLAKTVEEKKITPVKFECDVLVAGGGTSGVVAALAAARNGAKTVLVERYGNLGGTMINGAGPLHGFFNTWKAFAGVEKKQLVRGIAQEIIDRMIDVGGSLGHVELARGYDYDSVATIIDREVFKAVAFEMFKEAGIRLLLHTLVVDAVLEGGSVTGIIVESKSGREAVLANTTIDTTGDADVAFRSGVKCHVMKRAASTPFGMNVDLKKAVEYFKDNRLLTELAHADKGSDHDDIVRIGFDLGKLDAFDEIIKKINFWGGPLTISCHENDLGFINITNTKPVNAVDIDQVTQAEMDLREQVMDVAAFLKQHIPGFEKAYLNWTSSQFGARCSRIVDCEYDLSVEDIVEGRRFHDEVVLYGFHDMAPEVMVKNGGAYGIPYRSLLPRGVDNLLVAGRLITQAHKAHQSTRNVASCMAQGQAVGTAAALCCMYGVTPRMLDTNILRKTLIKDGVYLGD